MNHNQLLGVSPDASAHDIQSAFRKAALEIHPDHSDAPEAAEAFARIKEARDELMKRATAVEAARDNDSIQHSTVSAVRAATNAAYSTQLTDDLFDGMTPDEVAHVQQLDQLARQKPKRTLFKKVKEPLEVARHRKKINTTNRRILGKY